MLLEGELDFSESSRSIEPKEHIINHQEGFTLREDRVAIDAIEYHLSLVTRDFASNRDWGLRLAYEFLGWSLIIKNRCISLTTFEKWYKIHDLLAIFRRKENKKKE